MMFNSVLPHKLKLLPPGLDYKDADYIDLLIKARAELGELKGYSFSMPNPMLLLSPAIIKESLASSEIENINTTIINVFENQLFPEIEQREPDKEVLRYRDAVLQGFKDLDKYAVSTRTICQIKQTLLPESPEGYRTNQNGIQNTATKNIIYTPPLVSDINGLMKNLETFANSSKGDIDPLIKSAIVHYQFEAIHPFTDANGRTGRIIMVLNLVQSGILSIPILYISGYINKNKSEYYRLLLEVTTKGNWKEYIIFMLKGFYEQAKETKELLFEIMNIYFALKKELKLNHKKIYSADLADALISYPIITPAHLAKEMSVHRDTSAKYLNELLKAGILGEKKVGKYHFYFHRELLKTIHN